MLQPDYAWAKERFDGVSVSLHSSNLATRAFLSAFALRRPGSLVVSVFINAVIVASLEPLFCFACQSDLSQGLEDKDK